MEIENKKISAQMIGVRYVGVILPMGLMLFMGVILVSKEIVTPGTVIAFSSLCTSVRGLLEISNTILKTWRRSLATSERIYEIMELDERLHRISITHQKDFVGIRIIQLSRSGVNEFVSKKEDHLPIDF